MCVCLFRWYLLDSVLSHTEFRERSRDGRRKAVGEVLGRDNSTARRKEDGVRVIEQWEGTCLVCSGPGFNSLWFPEYHQE